MTDGEGSCTGDGPAAGAILRAFGLGGAPRSVTPVAGAWSHRLYRLETAGQVYAVKQLLNPWDEPGWRDWLVEAWGFELHAYQAGISMPRPVAAIDGGCVADVETADGSGLVPVRVHEWVDGRPCPSGPVGEAVAQRVGADLGRMHGLDYAPGRRDVFPQPTRSSVDGWPVLVERLRERDPDLAAAARAVEPWVARAGDMFDATETDNRRQVMSHGDVDQKNLLLTDAGPVLCDWDVAAPWNRRSEQVRTAMSLASWERPEVARSVINGYKKTAQDHGDDLAPPDLAHDLVISVDWVVFCLECATGLRRADPRRSHTTGAQALALLAEIPRHVDIATNIAEWLRSDA